jgi:hypothetical protein
VNDIRVSARRHVIGGCFDEARAVIGSLVLTNEFDFRWKTRKTDDGERTGRRGRRHSGAKARTCRRRRTARDRPCCVALSAAPQGCDRDRFGECVNSFALAERACRWPVDRLVP